MGFILCLSCRPLSKATGWRVGYRYSHISIPHNRTRCGRRLWRLGLTDACVSHLFWLCLASAFGGLGFSFPYCVFIISEGLGFVNPFSELFFIFFQPLFCGVGVLGRVEQFLLFQPFGLVEFVVVVHRVPPLYFPFVIIV